MRSHAVLPARDDLLLAALVGTTALLLTRLHADVLDRPLPPQHYVLVAVAGLALAWRRRWPVPTLVVTTAAVLPGYALGAVIGPALGVVAVAVYTVATRVRWPSAVGLGAVLVAVWAGAEAATGRLARDALDPLPWVTLAVAVGVAVGAIRHLHALRTAHEAEQRRLAVERERLRLAQEVHDVVSHSLAMINVQAGVAVHVADRRPEQALVALREIREASRAALAELRTTLGVVREPGTVDSPDAPPPGLHRLAEVVRAGTAAGLDVAVRGEPGPLPASVDRAAFRIVQEAVTNVVRHARGARRLTIELDRRGGVLVLRVGDDGRGPHVPLPRHGLRGIAERAAALGGRARAGPGGDGFVVVAELPVPAP